MKNKTSFVRKKEGARREKVRRAMTARFAHRPTDTVMPVAGVGNTSGNTDNRRDGESCHHPVFIYRLRHLYISNYVPFSKVWS